MAESWARFYRANAQGPRNWFNGEGWRGGGWVEGGRTKRSGAREESGVLKEGQRGGALLVK